MGDLGRIQGVYPAESAIAAYAYEDAALLLELLGDSAGADDLRDNYVAPMAGGFDDFFWHSHVLLRVFIIFPPRPYPQPFTN